MVDRQEFASEQDAMRHLFDEIRQLKAAIEKLHVQREAHRCVIGATRRILSSLDPEFKRLSDAHIRGLREHFLSLGLDENDPLVKATLGEAESFLAEDRPPLRTMMHVIQGGRNGNEKT